MIHTPATSAPTLERRGFYRFRLRWPLLLFIPLSISLALYSRAGLQRQRVTIALDRMNRIGVDAHFETNGDYILYATKANVTNSDLKALIPICSGEVRIGGHKIIRMELCGSQVSDEAIAEFRKSAPECELIR